MNESVKFLEEASRYVPENVEVHIELAYQYYLLKDYEKAIGVYKKVARLDDSATDALIGLIMCRLAENKQSEEVCKLQSRFGTVM